MGAVTWGSMAVRISWKAKTGSRQHRLGKPGPGVFWMRWWDSRGFATVLHRIFTSTLVVYVASVSICITQCVPATLPAPELSSHCVSALMWSFLLVSSFNRFETILETNHTSQWVPHEWFPIWNPLLLSPFYSYKPIKQPWMEGSTTFSTLQDVKV